MAAIVRSTFPEDAGKLILRLCLGVLLLFHGVGKLGHGVAWLADPLAVYGLPSFVAYGVYVGELFAPILLILGIFSRVGALIVIVNMVFVFGLVHMDDLTTLGKSGGWALELQGFFLFTAVAVALLGAGRYSLAPRSGPLSRWN